MKVKNIVIIAAIGVVVALLIIGGTLLTQNIGKSDDVISEESANKKMEKMINKISPKSVAPQKEAVELETTAPEDELPDINTYPLGVTGNTELNIEILSSPEKAGDGTDGWLIEVAESFNKEGYEIDGKKASISIRKFDSGTMVEYISSGKYIPDAISPSNVYWGKMLEADGIQMEQMTDRIAGNVPGVMLSEDKYKELTEKYGTINMKTITQATVDGELSMGYTNPLASSTGLNFLVQTLYTYDSDNILSDTAKEGFNSFQTNVPFVSFTTMQMRTAAESGSLDGFIMEYQSYENDSDLKRDYKFTPFGIRHDNPVYAVGSLAADKKELLKKFVEYCQNDDNQALAEKYGFNKQNEYKAESPEFDGDTLLKAQKLWKENKDVGTPILAVFVTDVSGSMEGEPINMLKNSLINSMQYINTDNYVGLISYNDSVYINLPVGQFDLNQQAYFKGTVNSLMASGGTATYDAVTAGVNMLLEAMNTYPNAKPMLFLLSDGDCNVGYSLNDVREILTAYRIPVYTIGYNAEIKALEQISAINEAASINADTEDVTYKLKNLFNAQM